MPIIVLLLLILINPARADFPSEELRQLWDVPTAEVKAETVKRYVRRGVRVEEIYYQSRPYKGKPVRIFGYFCYPRVRAGRLPAILLSHGGGGGASLPRASAWARHGYAVLAIDLPGKGERRAGSRSTGPDMDVKVLLRTQPDPSYNYLVHAVAAARNGITYLTQRPEVDPERIGMIGLSWGGVLTLLTNGQDHRLKAAVNIFGAGYIPEGCTWEDRFSSMPALDYVRWNTYIDPKNFLDSQHAPIFFITGTNDHCYYLPTFQKSYDQVKVEKNYYLIANLRHRFLASAERPALAWLDQKLKRPAAAALPPRIEELPVRHQEAGKAVIPVRVLSGRRITGARLYYAAGGPLGWTGKKWLEVRPYFASGVYYFSLPERAVKPEVIYYVSARDDRGLAASSQARSLLRVQLPDGSRMLATSAAIRRVFYHEPPITLTSGLAIESKLIFSEKDGLYEPQNPR